MDLIVQLSDGGLCWHAQICTPTLPGAATEASSCACKGLDGVPGSVCTSSSLSSGSGHVSAALCTGYLRGPGGTQSILTVR